MHENPASVVKKVPKGIQKTQVKKILEFKCKLTEMNTFL